ncbi:MAG: lamin tail domain-containing protein [Candidatus Moraniibacteriota bacterium]|nr:MAG: lamin tail domain-containing protein [Candidatus Moranbacteria bacterium]
MRKDKNSAEKETAEFPSITHTETKKYDRCGASKDTAKAGVVFSEILSNPKGDEDAEEYIELENTSDRLVDLSEWKLRDASKTGKYTFPNGLSIPAHAFLVLARSDFSFSLNNTNETLTLEDPRGETADTVSWKTSKENIALARDQKRWRSTSFLTRDKANQFGSDPTLATTFPKKAVVGVPLEFSASLRNGESKKTKVAWNFGDGKKSYKGTTTHTFAKKGRYTITVTGTDGVSDLVKTKTLSVKKYETPTIRIVALMPNPAGKDTKVEWITIENRSKKSVDLKGWSIATKSKTQTKNFTNHLITKSLTIKPGEKKRLTKKHAAFTLGNTRQYIELRDPRKKTLQSIRYKLEKSAPDDAVYTKTPGRPWTWSSAS